MTIAEPIQTLEYLKNSGVFPFSTKEGVLYTAESINALIDTIRKYQKIEQIIKNHDNDRMPEDYWYIDEIREVLEDGNDN